MAFKTRVTKKTKHHIGKIIIGSLLMISFGAANAWVIFPDNHSKWGTFCKRCWSDRSIKDNDHTNTPYSGTASKASLEKYAKDHENHTGEKTLVVKDREEFNKLMAKKPEQLSKQ